MSANVTFIEIKSYFTQLSLQREPTLEYKGTYLSIDLNFSHLPSTLALPLTQPEENPHTQPTQEILRDSIFDQLYLRWKISGPKLRQVQA